MWHSAAQLLQPKEFFDVANLHVLGIPWSIYRSAEGSTETFRGWGCPFLVVCCSLTFPLTSCTIEIYIDLTILYLRLVHPVLEYLGSQTQ